MNKRHYQKQLIRLYQLLPDTPNHASRADRRVAAQLFDDQIPLERLLHAMMLASLRRHHRNTQAPHLMPVRSLAYYRHVLLHLTDEELEPGYANYIAHQFQNTFPGRLLTLSKTAT